MMDRKTARERARRTVKREIRKGNFVLPSKCHKCDDPDANYWYWNDVNRPLDVVIMCPRCYRSCTPAVVHLKRDAYNHSPSYEATKRMLLAERLSYEDIGRIYGLNPGGVRRTFLARAEKRGEREAVLAFNAKLRMAKIKSGQNRSRKVVEGGPIMRRVKAYVKGYRFIDADGIVSEVDYLEATAAFAQRATVKPDYLRRLLDMREPRLQKWYAMKLLMAMNETVPDSL